MTLPYEIVSALLFAEVMAFTFLITPLPKHWRKGMLNMMSKSSLFERIKYGLKILFVFVVILFIDACNRTFKATQETQTVRSIDLHADTALHAKMFYAQRNMYLTGFTLFLALVLNRFTNFLMEYSKMEDSIESVKKQASRQGTEYTKLIEQVDEKEELIKTLKAELNSIGKKIADADAAMKQAKSQQDEYMRLADRYNELEKKLERRQTESGKDK